MELGLKVYEKCSSLEEDKMAIKILKKEGRGSSKAIVDICLFC